MLQTVRVEKLHEKWGYLTSFQASFLFMLINCLKTFTVLC